MLELSLHHVSVPTSDLDRSDQFYEQVLGLQRLPRSPFTVGGIWYGIGRNQIHLVVLSTASFRTGRNVDNDDIHFAIRAEDFEAAYAHVKGFGFDENLPADHPKKMIVKRTGLASFP